MAKVGRPRALDEVKQRQFCALVSLGHPLSRAAAVIGCSPRTVRRLANRDPEFDEAWRRAELAAVVTPLKTIQQAAGENWRAASWFMERVLPEQFVKRPPHGLTFEVMNEYTLEMVNELLSWMPKRIRPKAMRRLEMYIELWQRDWGPTRIRKGPEKLPPRKRSKSARNHVKTVHDSRSSDSHQPSAVDKSGVNATEMGVN